MKLQLYSVGNRYAFAVGKFASMRHFLICPDIKPTYQYAWEAYRDAQSVFKNQTIHVEAANDYSGDDLAVSDLASETHEESAEQMIVDHYSKIYELMAVRTKTFKDDKDKEFAYGEAKGIVGGMLKVKENLEKDDDKKKIDEILTKFRKLVKDKFPKLLAKDKKEMDEEDVVPEGMENLEGVGGLEAPMDEMGAPMGAPMDNGLSMMPTASQIDSIVRYGSNNLSDLRTEVLDEYSERICKCIEKLHPDAICNINYENGTLKVNKAGGEAILRISVNDDLHMQDVEPAAEISDAFPIHSLEFYQKYWKPIVEKVGHCYARDLDIVICPNKSSLPDIPNEFPNSVKIMGWNVKDKAERPFEISFGGETPTWKMSKIAFTKTAIKTIRPSKYTEEDFIQGQPRRVECIDPNLQSIYGKIGEVVQVLPLQEHIEVDVNFGRLVVRLTEHQIELMDEIPTNI